MANASEALIKMKSSRVSPADRLSYLWWKRPPAVIAAHPCTNASVCIHEQRQADRGQGVRPTETRGRREAESGFSSSSSCKTALVSLNCLGA